MKTFGKIKNFNGYNGLIRGIDGKDYILMRKEVYSKDNLQEDDHVYFEIDHKETPEISENIARFVKKLEIKRGTK